MHSHLSRTARPEGSCMMPSMILPAGLTLLHMADRLFREEMAYGKVGDLKDWFKEFDQEG